MQISIVRDGVTLVSKSSKEEVYLVFDKIFLPNDKIMLSDLKRGYYFVSLGLKDTILYSNGDDFTFNIPFEAQKEPYDPKAYTLDVHYFYIREAYPFELTYRNLALNPYDQAHNSSLFPHSRANVETRGESVFFSRNAFDGIVAASSHGKYPFQSWGINRDPNAELTLEFGRAVLVDRVIIYTRSDFPHDAWWIEANIDFSDSSSITLKLDKKDGSQIFTFEKRVVDSLKLNKLIKSDDPSPFPALTALEVYGVDV